MAEAKARTLTVDCEAGMCNRIRVLLSGQAIALASQRTFAMHWKPQPACGATFEQLFQNEWNVRADIFFDRRHGIDVTALYQSQIPDWLTLETTNLHVHHFSWLHQPHRYPAHAALETQCIKLYNELVPQPEILQRVNQFKEKFFRAKMFGVHLRRGDMSALRPDVTDNAAIAFEQIDRWLEETQDAGILLCTDDGAQNPYNRRATPFYDLRARFARRYGNRIVSTTPSSLDRHAPQAIRDALVDLWLLRATDAIIGTTGSSFSYMAAYGRNVPLFQAAGSSPKYRHRQQWLERIGLAAMVTHLSRQEFGVEVPYTYLIRRYRRRMRAFLTRYIS